MTRDASPKRALATALAGGVLLLACLGFLAARPDPGVPSGVAIAMPGAPQTLPVDDLDKGEFALVNWAISGLALAFSESSELNRKSRLSLVASPRAAHRLLTDYGVALGDPGFADPAAEIHDVDIEGFTLARAGRDIVVEASWRPLALMEGDAHSHLPGRAFSARLTLSRGPAQWQVTAFELTASDG